MSNKARNTSGKFAAKSEVPRKVRSVNLTDIAWTWLAAVAERAGMSRNDYLEAMAEGNIPLMETVQPLMETVQTQSSPFVEMAEAEIEPSGANIAQQLDSELPPLMEMVGAVAESLKQELEDARADYAALLESSTVVTNKLRQELAEVRSQLATERADREEIEMQLSDLKQNSATASKDLPEAADLLNRLKGERKKVGASLADIQAILGMIKESCDDTSQED